MDCHEFADANSRNDDTGAICFWNIDSLLFRFALFGLPRRAFGSSRNDELGADCFNDSLKRLAMTKYYRFVAFS